MTIFINQESSLQEYPLQKTTLSLQVCMLQTAQCRIMTDRAGCLCLQIFTKHMLHDVSKPMQWTLMILLLNTNILFRDFPDVLAKYQERFNYVLVDEYQDTNYSQYLIVKKLAASHQNICVVGDDAQSIYSFRGARIENILEFKNDYTDYQLFKLEQNYRSTQTIVNAANTIIANNEGQIQKNVFSMNETGEKIQVLQAMTDSEEGFNVSSDIFDKKLSQQLNWSDFAILYRTNAQSRIFEETLQEEKYTL